VSRPLVLVRATTNAPVDTPADTVAVGVFDGKGVPHDVGGALGALLEAGEAKTAFRHLAVAHAAGKRWILVGLGARDDFTPERARVVATAVHARAKELGAQALCWELPHRLDDRAAGAFVEGTLLAAYAFTRYRPDAEPPALRELLVSDHEDRSAAVDDAAVVARAVNLARELQDTPANDLTPAALGERAQAVLEPLGVGVQVGGPERLAELRMGAFAAVAQGSDVPPALIVARYDGPRAPGGSPVLGLVGKAVTHDTGGLSIKPAASMDKMKFDMSGGAAVLGAVAAIAELALPVRLVAVIGATENTIGPSAVKPGDIVTAMNGVTIEVNNTDAEGRLVLCDCLSHAIDLGAERLVDLATLTGGVVTALGTVYAGAFANDEAWAAAVLAAGEATHERLWRLPLDPDYAEQIAGRYAEIVNSPESRKAHPIMGAEFLHRFAGEVPWAHLDIAGVAYDAGRPWAPKAGTGFGVRLLVELARAHAGA
jgi:leucyl aminopeptidase